MTDKKFIPVKKCPFCGKQPVFYYSENGLWYRYYCRKRSHHVYTGLYKTWLAAIRAWNRRKP